MELPRGFLLRGGKYKIVKALGQGSFGITYLAVDTLYDTQVAIKEFFMKSNNSRYADGSVSGMQEGSDVAYYRKKFLAEAEHIAELKHPNIIRVKDCFDENNTSYYVMDYIDGTNLNDYITRYQISEDKAVAIIKEVAKGLSYLHEKQRMLHLDLKPGNIMRRKGDGHIFLIDFGLSKRYDSNGNPETSTNVGLGTEGYAPVEQGDKTKRGEFRPTIDVYALGATLYKLLTRETPPASSELVSNGSLLSRSLQRYGVSSHLSRVVIHSMQPNVNLRIKSVKAFVDELDNYDEGTSTLAGTDATALDEPEEEIRILNVSPQTLTVSNNGGKRVLHVECNDSWQISGAQASWAHPVKEGNRISITFDANEGGERSDYFSIKSGDLVEIVRFTQKSGYVAPSSSRSESQSAPSADEEDPGFDPIGCLYIIGAVAVVAVIIKLVFF